MAPTKLKSRQNPRCLLMTPDLPFTARFSVHYEPSHPIQTVEKRQVEYLAGRHCVEQAFASLGAAAVHVASRADRSPAWPTGFVGSITHTLTESVGFASAVVVSGSQLAGVGIDSEQVLSTARAEEVRSLVMTDAEWELCRRHSSLSLEQAATLVFSAKESFYKCLNPVTGQYFDFLDAELLELGEGTYRIRLLRELGPGYPAGLVLEGAYELERELAHTGMELTHGGLSDWRNEREFY